MSTLQMSSLRVCRGCLATDVRLHDMRENRLMEAYSTLIQPELETDNLPPYICSYCAGLLLKWMKFRIKCNFTLSFFKNIQLNNVDVNLDQLKQIKRPQLLKQSKLLTITISETANSVFETHKDSEKHENHLETKTSDVTEESVVDIENSKDLEMEKDAILSNNGLDDDEEFSDEEVYILALDTVNVDSDKNTFNRTHLIQKLLKFVYNGNTKTGDEIKDMLSNFTGNVSKDNEVNTKYKFLDQDNVKNFLGDIHEFDAPPDNIVEIKGLNDLLKAENDDLEAFCTVHNVNVVILSEEDQLKEIEDRKETINYMHSLFKCDVCFKGFLVEKTYNNHMQRHDAISGPCVCKICKTHFANKKILQKHTYLHEKKYICKLCGHTVRTKWHVVQHHKWHRGARYKCKHCHREYDRISSYCGHMKSAHPNSDALNRCEICGTVVLGASGLRLHDMKAHREMTSPECLCTVCGTQFYCSDAFKAHQGADGACSSRAKYCVRCGGAFRTQLQLEAHEAEQRKLPKEFKCVECDKTYKSYQSYDSHMKYSAKHTKSPRVQKYIKNKYKPKSFVCDLCGKLFVNIHYLRSHQLTHTEERPYKCRECPKTFKSQIYLQTHMQVHQGGRPRSMSHMCHICAKTFDLRSNLTRHMIVHSEERPYACDICKNTFQTKTGVQTHIKSVHMNMRVLRDRSRKRKHNGHNQNK